VCKSVLIPNWIVVQAKCARWATEDPNPVSQVAEKRRLEEIGTAAIQAKLDPRIADAMRAIRALEDGEETPQSADDDEYAEDVQEKEDRERIYLDGPRKRPRIGNDPLRDDDHPTFSSQPSGLLTAETMDGLKYFAQLRQGRGSSTQLAATNAPKSLHPTTASIKGLGGLGEYGSDEDDD
jgi:hypothetical protein